MKTIIMMMMSSMLVDLTARALSLIPPWMRVYRIQVIHYHYHHHHHMHLISSVISQCHWLHQV